MRVQTGLDYQAWSRALVRHFFGADRNSPTYWTSVRHLAVSDEELQIAAEYRHASPKDARNDLFCVFRKELEDRSEKKSFEAVYRPSKELPTVWEPPQSIIPLLISCIVAAEQATDENYRDAFDDACGNGRSNDTSTLPRLWEELRNWLRACRERDDDDFVFHVRDLILPPRPETGWRNIFYSVALTFPNRRDREVLRGRLEPLATRELTPTLSEVIAALESIENSFNTSFRTFFDDFRRQGSLRSKHPFWHAVQCVWRELAGLPAEDAPPVRLSASVLQGRIYPYALVQNEQVAKRFERAVFEAPDLDDVWKFVLVDSVGEPEGVVAELLAGSVQIPGISRDITRGIIALESKSRTHYEWIGGIPPTGHGIVLVRSSGPAMEDLRRLITGRAGVMAESQATQFEGWRLVEVQSFGSMSGDSDVLSMTPSTPLICVIDGTGLRTVGGFLGHPRYLPCIFADQAHRVTARSAATGDHNIELERDGDSWIFPANVYRGQWVINAEDERGSLLARSKMDFTDVPAHSEFREPTRAQRERLLLEGINRDFQPILPTLPSFLEDGDQRPFPGEGLVYLGPAVGAFRTEPAPEFDWVADIRARTLSFVGDASAPTPPSKIVMGKSPARMWRKCFKDFAIGALPERIQQTYNAYREMVGALDLTRRDSGNNRPKVEADTFTLPLVVESDPGVEDFTVGLAAAAASRHGISEVELFRVLDCAFGQLEWSVKWNIVRAWAEAGIVEPAMDARWPARKYFVRRPRLVFTDALKRRAVIAGLVSPKVRDRILALTNEKCLRVEHVRSLSPWGPTLMSITEAASIEHLLQQQENFRSSELLPILEDVAVPIIDIEANARRALNDLDNYDGNAKTWSWNDGRFIVGKPDQAGVTVRLVQRPRVPDRYEIVIDGRVVWWTHSRTWAFLAAINYRGENPFLFEGSTVVVPTSSAVRLPLALARASSVRGAVPGPRRAGDYAYWFPDRPTALAIIRRLLPQVPLTTE